MCLIELRNSFRLILTVAVVAVWIKSIFNRPLLPFKAARSLLSFFFLFFLFLNFIVFGLAEIHARVVRKTAIFFHFHSDLYKFLDIFINFFVVYICTYMRVYTFLISFEGEIKFINENSL